VRALSMSGCNIFFSAYKVTTPGSRTQRVDMHNTWNLSASHDCVSCCIMTIAETDGRSSALVNEPAVFRMHTSICSIWKMSGR
jgi:hypothetical protein